MDFYNPSDSVWDKIVNKQYKPKESNLFNIAIKNVVARSIDLKVKLYFDDILQRFNVDILNIDVNDVFAIGDLKRNALSEAQFILSRLPNTNPVYGIMEQVVQEGLMLIVNDAKEKANGKVKGI